MAADVPAELRSKLAHFDQSHVLRTWDGLSVLDRRRLQAQVESLDLGHLKSLVDSRRSTTAVAEHDALAARARRAMCPPSVVRLPQTAADHDRWERARQTGEQLLKSGKVGAILVAGGQGTRLGFEHPKGMFPIGPVSSATLFQILAEQLLARSRRAGTSIPYLIMTSDATHDETVAFFAENRFFGLPSQDVYFFAQGNMPAVDSQSGKLLLAENGMLSTSPDGHGGMLTALGNAGLLDEMAKRGIEFLHYHQVDNPTVIVGDPVFLGFHALFDSEISTKVVAKREAAERMGVAVEVDGRTEIIEYSDLPADIAAKTDARGNLLLWAGSTAIHVFSRTFLERMLQRAGGLPFHVAHKKVPFLDERGTFISPQTENAFKFERFIFDALPAARRALVLETDRRREFNPVKNATGDDSPDTARAALLRLYHGWLSAAGVVVDKSRRVEIGPRFALDADELRAKIAPGTHFTSDTYLSE